MNRHARIARDRGSATIWTAGAIAVLFVIATVLLAVGVVTATRHRAVSGADLAALAAAEYAPDGEPAACDRARSEAEHMGVRLVSCRLSGWNALVEVAATPPDLLGRFGAATARACAGPAEA